MQGGKLTKSWSNSTEDSSSVLYLASWWSTYVAGGWEISEKLLRVVGVVACDSSLTLVESGLELHRA